MRRFARPLASTLLLAALLSCGGDDPVDVPDPDPTPTVASVAVSPPSATLEVGETTTLTAEVRDARSNPMAGQTVTWSSQTPAVAGVSGNGVVTALAPGTAAIVATSAGRSGQASITVTAVPVGSVAITPPAATVVVGESTTLTATVLDAAGNVLEGRTVVWASSDPDLATVDGQGVVATHAPGVVTITATSDGHTAEATITITPAYAGVEIGPEGGSFELDDGGVRIDVPAGAVGSATTFGAAVSTRAHADPEGSWLVGGAVYTLHPEGATFDQPVTVTLRYDPGQLPTWVDPATLGLTRWDGTDWYPLDNVVVDVDTHTISGTTTGFSDVSPEFDLPEIVILPNRGHVNDVQREVVLVAELIDLSTEFWFNFTYEWTSTQQSGSIFHTMGNSAHYLATKGQMARGEELDVVTVTMMAERVVGPGEEEGVLHPIGSASITVRADLEYAIDLVPTHGETEFGGEEQFELVIRDRDGNQIQNEIDGLRLTWSVTGYHGTLDAPLDQRTSTNPVTYRAKDPDQQEFPAPRVDQIEVLIEQRYRVFAGTAGDPFHFEIDYRTLGEAEAFVRVRASTMSAKLAIGFVPSGTGGCMTAYYDVKKIAGATSYSIMATDFGDNADPFGGLFELTWSGPSNDVLDHGDYWRIRLEGGCAQTQTALDARRGFYEVRYGNARIEVTVVEPD